jgi:hypothetical protein
VYNVLILNILYVPSTFLSLSRTTLAHIHVWNKCVCSALILPWDKEDHCPPSSAKSENASSSSSSSSLGNLSYDRSIAHSKACSPQIAIYCFLFNFQYPVISLRSSSSCVHILTHLFVTSIVSSIFPPKTCCRRQFLRKMLTNPFRLPSCYCMYWECMEL